MKSLKRTQNALLRAGYVRSRPAGFETDHHMWIDVTPANGKPISFWESGEHVVWARGEHVDGAFQVHGWGEDRPELTQPWAVYVDSLKAAIRLARICSRGSV